jgi:hypothetical protein
VSLPVGVNSSGITAQPATELAPLPYYKETTRNCDLLRILLPAKHKLIDLRHLGVWFAEAISDRLLFVDRDDSFNVPLRSFRQLNCSTRVRPQLLQAVSPCRHMNGSGG